MDKALKKFIERQLYRFNLFPTLLLVLEELPTWEARAEAFNAVGIKTLSGRSWTKGNLHALYKSYYSENGGRYSHNEHHEQLKQLEELVA